MVLLSQMLIRKSVRRGKVGEGLALLRVVLPIPIILISERACLIPYQCVLCSGAGIKMFFEDYCWSVLSPKLAKLNSFMKVVSGIFLFAEGLTVMYSGKSRKIEF